MNIPRQAQSDQESPGPTPDQAHKYLDRAVAAVIPPLAERARLLMAWAHELEQRAEAVAQTVTASTGKPIRCSRQELTRSLSTLRGTVSAMTDLRPRVVDLGPDGQAEIHSVPLGPVLAVTPFNFPVNLALHKLAPAIAAGCPVIFKPSPKAPGVAEAMMSAWAATGAPPDLIQLAHLTNEEVLEVIGSPRLAVFSFTGSDLVGHQLQARVARAQVAMELGGNAAVIIHQVDDPDAVARKIAIGACAQAGQVCISVQRIFIPAQDRRLRQCLIDAFAAVETGDPRDERVWCGPVIDPAAKERIGHLVDGYRSAGGRILTGGAWDGLTMAPTLIEGVAASDPGVACTEAFAPLATLHPYDDIADAIAEADATPFGLQAGLFSHDAAVIRETFSRLTVGSLVVNDVPTRRNDRLPYGGLKESGCGREGTDGSIMAYSQPRVLWRTDGV